MYCGYKWSTREEKCFSSAPFVILQKQLALLISDAFRVWINSRINVFVFVPADVMEGKSAILLGMSQWNSNDLVEQIETLGHMDDQSHGTYMKSQLDSHIVSTREKKSLNYLER